MISALVSSLLLAGFPATSYVQPGFKEFDPRQRFRSVGVFGSFGKGTELQERDNVGLLTFTLKKSAPENSLVWANFDNGKDLELGRAVFPGQVTDKRFEFTDWTTASLKFNGSEGGHPVACETVFSRAFPAVLYSTEAHLWSWRPGALRADHAAYRTTGGRIAFARPGDSIGPLTAPWVLLWNDSGLNGEVAPLLIRFEHRPESVRLSETLQAAFNRPAGGIVVMPLMGVRRLSDKATASWHGVLPADVVAQADFWSRATAAFPTGTEESFYVDDAAGQVRITDRYRYRTLSDDWRTKPIKLAPVPPVTALAAANGYPVKFEGKVVRSSVATLLGPYAYLEGGTAAYTIPIPAARDNALTPVRVLGDATRQRHLDALDQLVRTNPLKPEDGSDGGLNLQLKEYAQGYPLLPQTTRAALRPALSSAFQAAYAPANLQTVTDPVTNARYVMSSKIWCVGEPYDREWYTGRQLDAACEYAAWIDPKVIKPNWQAIQGLYAYYRIYNDWAWSGTLSSVFAYALCGDGMNFAMEGMLGTARLARRVGDTELWQDASYRAAKQALCTYGSWYLSDWVKKIDYATWTDTSYDYAAKKGRYEIKRMRPEDVQTGFGLDIYSDSSGIKTFRPGSFWHASAAFYWNNPSLYRLYAETLYPKVVKWEMETMPRLFPEWTNRDAKEAFSNQPFGTNMVINHLDARTVLLGRPPEELERLTTKLLPDIALLYRVRMQEDLAQSGVPQLWLPTSSTSVEDATWNAKTRTLTATVRPFVAGPLNLDWTWRGTRKLSSIPDPGPKAATIRVNGRPVPAAVIKGGFYRIRSTAKAGDTIRLEIRY